MNEGGKMEASFWRRCAEDLKKYGVTLTTAAFFVEHAEKVSSYKERFVMKFANSHEFNDKQRFYQ